MRVKICGITNIKDALDAIKAGADALGFVFYPKSPRYIEPVLAKEIISKLPPFVQCVGLFVNEPAQTVNAIAKITKIDLAQIHFEAQDSFYEELEVKYLKVVRAQTKDDIQKDADSYRLIDAFVESYGGEGKRLNLEWFDNVDCSRIVLAGGLNIQNVKELQGYNFYSVDLSSGVEVKKGIKDKQKMIEFVNKVNEISQ
ncbi:MAG: phosphoribosylanthranilate isomerase [Campylobacterota bacterium]|nr:phosphoribosylanthranilate isomerase [Campylobacterota bacterium]